MNKRYFTMDISHIHKFKADDIISVMSGTRCSLGKAIDVKHGRDYCEQTQKLKHNKAI
jgi:hypothetical protein